MWCRNDGQSNVFPHYLMDQGLRYAADAVEIPVADDDDQSLVAEF